jgi:hypothetical protein
MFCMSWHCKIRLANSQPGPGLPDSGILVRTHISQWTDGLITLFLLFGNELGH